MRTISVSTEVFAAIWAERKPGEETEDQILARLLATKNVDQTTVEAAPIGFQDLRSGTKFPAGFEIFRTYKGKEYRAKAVGGIWVRTDTSVGYSTLNQLSQGLGIVSENAWRSWYFVDDRGKRQLIDALRQQ